jgi:hypothetical protein
MPYRYVFLEVATSTNGFIGCSTLNAWGNGYVDYALQSAGGTASAIVYTVNGSFPVTNVNDNDDTVFTTSSSSAAAGSGHGIQIDLGQSRNFGKIGFRRRTDSFGSNEAILTGFVKAKLNIGDAWTTIYTVSETWPGSYEYREWSL